jgi:hypothetical protein
VDESQAAGLLPLWQALQSLQNSDTAAALELEAVARQIQDGMTAAQISAIADMALTEESLVALLEEGTLALGFGGRGAAEGETPQGFPAEGFAGGGPPGGGLPGAGGGPGGGGSFPGAGGQGLDPEALATRQAEFAGGGAESLQERALTMAVVRLLRTKTGEAAEQPGLIFGLVFDVVGEATGLSVDEIQAQTAEGLTLAELVEARGGDVGAVRQGLIDAFGELPNADDLDAEQLADQWLGLSQ